MKHWLLAFLLSATSAFLQAESVLLPETQAFGFSATLGQNEVILNWNIAKGHYLLKQKIKVSADLSTQLGSIKLPQPLIRNDEFFGKIAVYRDNVIASIPILQEGADAILLTVHYQGCVDFGVCYPLISKSAAFSINTADAPSLMDKALGAFSTARDKVQDVFTTEQIDSEPLNPDKAFKFSATALNADTLLVTWQIEDNYYLYHDKFWFDIKGAEFADFDLPRGKIKNDEFFGKTEVHKKQFNITLPLQNISAPIITFIAKYQGCWEGGVCYPPQQKTLAIALPATTQTPAALNKPIDNANPVAPNITDTELNETDKIASLLQQDNLLLILLSFFAFGLLLSFTPCVFPMIPILSGIIIGQKTKISTQRALLMSIVFVLAMSLTYAGAGVIAGYFGQNLQILFQTPWVIMLFSGVFVILAFSMFGYFDIQLPARLQNSVSNISNKQKGGSLFGVFIMGFLSALIVGPCVAPPLAGALIYIGQTGDALLGGLSLFVLSLGMGVPLVLIGAGVSKLPKAGGWMNKIKHIFGILMLAIAIYLLDRIISPLTSLILWATLISFAPIALGALKPLRTNAKPWQSIFKGAGLILLGYGLLIWLLVARGGGDMLQPLSGWGQSTQSEQAHLRFSPIKSSAELDTALQQAATKQELVMLDFYADWCISCKVLERAVFADDKVVNAMQNVILLQADVTKNNANDQALMKRFNIIGPPAILFFKNGKELKSKRIIGELSAAEFLANINGL